MLDTSAPLSQCAAELNCQVEQLLTPLTQFRVQDQARRRAIDNGAYAGFDATRFANLLRRERPHRALVRWVAVPDVPGSARRTREAFDVWSQKLSAWPLAYVCQDGQQDIEIPWRSIEALFIGGSTSWKMSRHAEHAIRCAQLMGKWVHVGRVNTPLRFEHFRQLRVNSTDGSGLARFGKMRRAIGSMLAPEAKAA